MRGARRAGTLATAGTVRIVEKARATRLARQTTKLWGTQSDATPTARLWVSECLASLRSRGPARGAAGAAGGDSRRRKGGASDVGAGAQATTPWSLGFLRGAASQRRPKYLQGQKGGSPPE